MHTRHVIHYEDARDLHRIAADTVHLVVTSPPYPMISMWDEAFCRMNPQIRESLDGGDGPAAYRLMHAELSRAWNEVYRVLVPGGTACINIGDATRKIGTQFRLYPNHTAVLSECEAAGFDVLPGIIWRKPTNSPTKFMGSGMLPPAAYVTLEHERILVLRKPTTDARATASYQSARRQESAYFWEERNKWFSDFWELNGTRQALNGAEIRKRSGAFPLEIALRLVNMFSAKLDVVLDPFLGTGTTTLACLACCRNSIGYEIETGFRALHREEIPSDRFRQIAADLVTARIASHAEFIRKYVADSHTPKYRNKHHGFAVVTRQETGIVFHRLIAVTLSTDSEYVAQYDEIGPLEDGTTAATP